MVGFRVVLPDADVVDVPEATDYVVTDDGTLVLQAGGSDLLRLPAGGWLQVGDLDRCPPPDVAALLDELCVDLGFCLPSQEYDRLEAGPARDPDAFTDAVLEAEGLDPLLVDKQLRRALRARVAWHFAAGKR
jgi:hypothetical protein